MKKTLLRSGLGLAVLGLVLLEAPVASATDVTNPADNPYPVTVTIDGQTYHDGQDTLPGYDDVACTAIPNVQYDFDANQIDYYDDDGNLLKTAPWTEWSRISSYAAWKAQHSGSGSSGSGSSGSGSSGSGSSGSGSSGSGSSGSGSSGSGSSGSGSSGSGSSGSGSSGTGHTKTPTKGGHASASSSATATPSAGATSSAQPTDSASATPGATPSDSPTAGDPSAVTGGSPVQAAAAVVPEKLSPELVASVGKGNGSTREAGLAVLVGLAAASLVVWLGGLVRGRRAS